ncbi:hypothetical protein [Streptomyces sp. SM12]|uniref:hypothetical protein n=1 Tax=Streptomyces sp. SM12 TaxID=1071602 RepID=UPI000CD56BBD|nr:hypothetical protein [Streptomyces sp. SM12]
MEFEKIRVTDDEVMRVLREVVAERPEFVYTNPSGESGNPGVNTPTCFYVHGEVPGCVIGHLLHRLGVPLAVLRNLEHDHASAVIDEVMEGVTDAVVLALTGAQAAQDHGNPWSVALERAEAIRFAQG